MMRELLFVGGPADGKRIEVDDGLHHVFMRGYEADATVSYRREKLAEGIKEYDIMFFGADGRGVIETLLAGYKGPNKQKSGAA